MPTNIDGLLPQIARMPKITAQPFVNKLSLSQKRHLDKLIDQQKMQFVSMDSQRDGMPLIEKKELDMSMPDRVY